MRPLAWRHCTTRLLHALALLLISTTTSIAKNVGSPIVATPSDSFIGYDGQWSALQIRVGTPEQYLSLLPSTLSSETWVIGADGCDGTSVCTSKRGGIFYANESSSWKTQDIYELGSEPQQPGFAQYGYYGYDEEALDDKVSLSNQIVAVVNTTNIWIGTLGLGVQNERFTGKQEQLPLLSSLVKERKIPSHSYGYTAGASYRLKSVPASLTLGGVDTNRFTPNDLIFTLASGYTPVVAINSISVASGVEVLPPNFDTSPMQLMDSSQAATFTIDTSTPFLSLPPSICDKFAKALNLTYNDALQLYLFDEHGSPDTLESWELTFSFSIGNLPGSSENVDFTLPYSAFNLQLSYPYPGLHADFSSPPTNYFPLRRAANASQYTIGRAFLQETYLTVDYERNNFALSQAVFSEAAVNTVNLLAITRPADSVFAGPDSSGLSTGAKAGIGVGVGLAVLLILVLTWHCVYRRSGISTKTRLGATSEKPKRRSLFAIFTRGTESRGAVSELLGDKRQPAEVAADASNSRFELPSNDPVEMAAADVSPSFYQSHSNSIQEAPTLQRDDSRSRSEQERRNSYSKMREVQMQAVDAEREGSPVPPYSPRDLDQRLSSSISPNSRHQSQAFAFGTLSSGEEGISPINNSSSNGSHRASTQPASPVSPDAITPDYPRPFDPTATTNRTPSRNHGPWLTPQTPGQPPSRSTSRSSRFREEGLSSPFEQESSSSGRFSWEQ